MTSRERRHLFAGLPITSFGTLTSRILGMLRDMATAALLGLARDGIMDAFVIAFRVPNLFRRLFGEGALAASYMPVLAKYLEESRERAWQLATVTLVWLSVVLTGIVVLSEGVCLLLYWLYGADPAVARLVGLSAVMLPYLLFICLAAQVSGTLNALNHFSVPAMAPGLLNICWLTGVWVVAPWFAPNHEAQAYVVAVSILVAGVLQFAAQLPMLWRFGFRFDYDWQAASSGVWQILRSMAPMVLGMAVTQINTFLDSMMAWGLTAPPDGPQEIAWLGGMLSYPFQQGATSAIYFGERLYQFPLGILGLAVATVIFPVLTGHAARGEHEKLGEDLTTGLRLIVFLALPAGAGLVLLANPLSELFFEHGDFTEADALRVGHVIVAYALGVTAFCASPVIVRGYYALGDQMTPLRIGMWAVAVNVVLNLLLIWPLAEAGLALSTSLAACFQAIALAIVFSRKLSRLAWRELARTTGQTVLATVAMTAAGSTTLASLPPLEGTSGKLIQVFLPIAASAAVFFVVTRLLKAREWSLLSFTGPRNTLAP
jgi:putative peptidoglycan lipid II flippase